MTNKEIMAIANKADEEESVYLTFSATVNANFHSAENVKEFLKLPSSERAEYIIDSDNCIEISEGAIDADSIIKVIID